MGPKGMGILYVDEHVKIHPILFGGGQQRDLRSGTENVPGIAGLGEAVKEIYTDFNEKMERLYGLREYFVEEIEKIEGTTVNGPKGREGAPHIVSVSFAGVRSEVLLHSLEDKGIYVSSGSACASNHPAVSETLKAIHVKKELLVPPSASASVNLRQKRSWITHWRRFGPYFRCCAGLREDRKGNNMFFSRILIKYGEIGIKGKNRYLFEDALVAQIRHGPEACGGHV